MRPDVPDEWRRREDWLRSKTWEEYWHKTEQRLALPRLKPHPFEVFAKGMTIGHLCEIMLPDVPEDQRQDILLEHTGWPCFFDARDEHPIMQCIRQLDEARRGEWRNYEWYTEEVMRDRREKMENDVA